MCGIVGAWGPLNDRQNVLANSRKVMKREAAVEVLIDINMAIMRGLRGEGDQT